MMRKLKHTRGNWLTQGHRAKEVAEQDQLRPTGLQKRRPFDNTRVTPQTPGSHYVLDITCPTYLTKTSQPPGPEFLHLRSEVASLVLLNGYKSWANTKMINALRTYVKFKLECPLWNSFNRTMVSIQPPSKR